MLKYILFGTGQYYTKYIEKIKEYVDVVCLVDNNIKKEGAYIDGKQVLRPDGICDIKYDRILLLAGNVVARQMYDQLVSLNVDNNKIQFVDEFFSEHCGNKVVRYKGESHIGIISCRLDYTGSSIAIINLARVLKEQNYRVSIVAFEIDRNLLNEMSGKGIDIILYPSIMCLDEAHLDVIDDFDVCIINTALMIDAVRKLRTKKRIVWWLHEASINYPDIFARYPNYKSAKFNGVKICAVSQIAQQNFNLYFPNEECSILPYALMDYVGRERHSDISQETQNERLIFAVIAGFYPLKAQLEFLTAFSSVEKRYPGKAEAWLIGRYSDSLYDCKVKSLAEQTPNVKVLGEKTQREIRQLYKDLDVVVCPSYEETMSIVVTEGFMNAKTCIVSDNTGSASFISDKVNGLICKAGNVESISECMNWCIDNRDKLDEIGDNARLIYEENFTEGQLLERVKRIMFELDKER